MEDIILAGFGGHALSVADSIEKAGKYRILGYTDIVVNPTSIYEYLGQDEVLEAWHSKGVHAAAVGVGYLGKGDVRDRLYDKLKRAGFALPPIIDPDAVLARDAEIGEGSYIGKGAVVNARSHVGRMCIINTHATLEHENSVGDFSHIAVGAALCGNVAVGEHVFIGANATIIQGVRIGMNTIIGAGSLVLRHVGPNTISFGIVRDRNEE